ncbi:MAG: Gfo/Idh/MocA family oxidoreductase [Clostridia bacterium]|nr:Gfo/Idh/MocA family oxidoreductase [Clostridia bacterium]
MRIGILGAGNIARTMARTVRGMGARGDAVQLYAVAARSMERAQTFAAEWGIAKAYGSYEAMLCDPQVDLVYVATPHSHHAQHAMLCIEHGKAVLCEKPFTGNAAQAEAVFAMAKERGVFITEAIWPRYMPSRAIIRDLLEEGVIGRPVLLTADFGGDIQHSDRIRLPELAGGALLDLGVYTINFASMVFGTDVERVESSAALLETGVDHTESISICYRGGQIAQLMNTVLVQTPSVSAVYGTEGCLVTDSIMNPKKIDIYDRSRRLVRSVTVPEQITGYEYEVLACMRALDSGALECPEMPHTETLRIMRMMDDLRAQWGVRYPFD